MTNLEKGLIETVKEERCYRCNDQLQYDAVIALCTKCGHSLCIFCCDEHFPEGCDSEDAKFAMQE